MRATGKTLPVVDFLVQNMSTHGLDKQTSSPSCNTALHLCVLYNQVESMKLLLRSGADTTLKNSQNKTPMDIAQELEFHTCQELVSKFTISFVSKFIMPVNFIVFLRDTYL